MALNAGHLLDRAFPVIEATVTADSCMLYSLGLGIGRDPLDRDELRYVYEKNLLMFPTMPTVLGYPGEWMTDPVTRITRPMILHGAESMRRQKPIPIGGAIRVTNKVTAIYDKGEGRGAVMVMTRTIVEVGTGDLLATTETQVFCRADGGCGGPSRPKEERYQELPARAPDRTVEWMTEPNAALIYRLSGDYNPVHADPDVAAAAGFARPILHGLCTYGCAAAAILRALPDRTLIGFEARFSNPVFPGETISVDTWEEGSEMRFRARVAGRNALVLDRGRALFE
jgi:acyl dehydratase